MKRRMFFFQILRYKWWLLPVSLAIFIACIEEADKPDPGKIVTRSLENGNIVAYIDPSDLETGHVHVFKDDNRFLYQIGERENASQEFKDPKPIHCLFVAIDRYREEPLNFCKQDMKTLRTYFHEYFAEYNQDVRIEELYDENATVKNVEESLHNQLENSERFSTCIFAFSGHGKEEGLSLYDQDIGSNRLRHYFQGLRSPRVIWIIDSCNSGSLADPKLALNRKSKIRRPSISLFPQPSEFHFLHCFLGNGKIIIGSSKPAQESKDGIFIRALVSHLKFAEESLSFPVIISRINEGLQMYNERCHPEYKLLMTPFARVYGDIRVAVIHFPK